MFPYNGNFSQAEINLGSVFSPAAHRGTALDGGQHAGSDYTRCAIDLLAQVPGTKEKLNPQHGIERSATTSG